MASFCLLQKVMSSSAAERLSDKFEADGDVKIIKQQIESMGIGREENQKWHALSLMIITILSLALALIKNKPELGVGGQPATPPRVED